MMTVPMDNSSPSPREIVQRLYKKNIELENRRRKSAQARIPSDPNIWQQMRENYEAIILEDHAFSEQHEIEYALWQLHYRRIEELRAHFSAALASTGSATLPGGKGPARPDRIKKIRTQFKTFLSEATGFYHELILKIRAKYGLPLGSFSEGQDNQIIQAKDGKKSTEMKKGLVSCHRCMIYLGDLARYKGLYGEGDSKTRDYAAASSYYLQAASFWPSSGNPHHQLAILASYSGDDLLSVYRYFRSLAVDNPFSTARDNLVIAFEKNRQSYTQLPGDTKASSVKTSSARVSAKGRGKGEKIHSLKDTKVEIVSREGAVSISEIYRVFCIRFVRLNGILFTRTSLETFGEVFSLIRGELHELLSSGPEEALNFGVDAADNGLVIVRLVAILVFTVHNVNRETEGQSYAEILQRSVLLQNAYKAAFELVACIIERCAQLHDPTKSYLLPGVLVFVEWLAGRPDIAAGSDLEEKQATARLFFWKQCISFLNKLMSTESVSSTADEDETCFFNMSRYDEGETGNQIALWEDFELRGFVPLLPAQLILVFSRKRSTGSNGGNQEKKIRVQRIIAAGKALMNVVQIDHQGIYFDHKMKKFAIGVEPQVPQAAPSDIPKSNGVTQEHTVEKRENFGVVQPNLQYFEGDEEEEEIVFKPLVTEKPIDVVAPNVYNYEAPIPASAPVLAPASAPVPAPAPAPAPRALPNGEWASYVESTTAPGSNLHVQYALDASQQPFTSYANTIAQPMQPVNPNASSWRVDEQDFFPNGMQNLNVVGNGLVGKAEYEQGSGVSRPPVFSHSLPQSANLTVSSMFSDQTKVSESMMVSQFDLIMSSGANTESLMMKPSTGIIAPLGKNMVSRPVRHPGPPPGFSLPPKPVDLPFGASNLKNESPLFDDYRWLDGYQLPSSTKMMVPNDSFNSTAQVYPHVMDNSNSLTSAASFPFPGKQAPIMPVQVESEENWRGADYKVLDHLNSYLEQQNQLQQPNQQSVPLPEQYEGHPLWSGRFFV